ncbi:hypothetical protein SIFV0014 [Sulfolobus islandicus filamentous virus]|uniref:Uncharacterized protein 14 n=1 Tax=Sulfolobus islandicus filamentous virus (isolate Iceland/Hveragerdi) TaxID=654908 RepID=Y014_SIFVH|nr:hypothetical protein SIFV0014 [Sulfolobus islandicus filamentous virus]Q914L6.1 RecName: Full=Uncharacterized protein 14 [Sulfolobus islandicus filamentous virus (isolate Hveragerdi)]AAL27725.1 hypothetical protein [Sulfolobus islandicus filamentous virus]
MEKQDLEKIESDIINDWTEADDLDDALDFLFMEKVSEFKIKFKDPLKVTEEEYRELLGNYDSSNSVSSNGITIDQYTYDEDDDIMYKLEFTYRKEDNKIYIYEVQGWREKKK